MLYRDILLPKNFLFITKNSSVLFFGRLVKSEKNNTNFTLKGKVTSHFKTTSFKQLKPILLESVKQKNDKIVIENPAIPVKI